MNTILYSFSSQSRCDHGPVQTAAEPSRGSYRTTSKQKPIAVDATSEYVDTEPSQSLLVAALLYHVVQIWVTAGPTDLEIPVSILSADKLYRSIKERGHIAGLVRVSFGAPKSYTCSSVKNYTIYIKFMSS